jgi:hypothetical protein
MLHPVHTASFVRQEPAVKGYFYWFDMSGEHIAGIVVAAGAAAIRADFAAADHRYASRAHRAAGSHRKPRVESPDDPSFVAKDQWI